MKPAPITWITAAPDEARANLRRLLAEHGETPAELSRFIGRADGYLARFLDGGSPLTLAPKDRLALASYFRVDPCMLGAAAPSSSDPT